MVSNANDDFPDPDTPVTTVRELCGISTSIFLRLWTRAPRTTMVSVDIARHPWPLSCLNRHVVGHTDRPERGRESSIIKHAPLDGIGGVEQPVRRFGLLRENGTSPS